MFKMMIFDCHNKKTWGCYASAGVTYLTSFFIFSCFLEFDNKMLGYMRVHVSVIDDKENYAVATFICLCS